MRPTVLEIQACVREWRILRYFPAEPEPREAIMDLLANLVGTSAQLAWLRAVMVNQVGEWPGPAQLRALFCTRFPPADGIPGPDCELRGHTAADIEGEKPRYEPLPEGEAQKLIAGIREPQSEPPLSDEERADIDRLNERIRAKNERHWGAQTAAARIVQKAVEQFRGAGE